MKDNKFKYRFVDAFVLVQLLLNLESDGDTRLFRLVFNTLTRVSQCVDLVSYTTQY